MGITREQRVTVSLYTGVTMCNFTHIHEKAEELSKLFNENFPNYNY